MRGLCAAPDVRVCSGGERARAVRDQRFHQSEAGHRQSQATHASQDNVFVSEIGRDAFAKKKIRAGARPAEDRRRESPFHSRSIDSRALPERRARRHLEPGQRRSHAPISERSWLADERSPRLARADQAGPGAEQGSPAQSRKRHDHGARRAEGLTVACIPVIHADAQSKFILSASAVIDVRRHRQQKKGCPTSRFFCETWVTMLPTPQR